MSGGDDLARVVAALTADETLTVPTAPALRDVDTTPESFVIVVCIDDEHRQRVIRDLRDDGYEVRP